MKVDLNIMIAMTLVTVSALYYGSVSNQGTNPDQVLKNLTGSTTGVLERVLPVVYPSYQSGLTVDQFIRRQLPDAAKVITEMNLSTVKTRNAKREVIKAKLRELGVDPATVNVEQYLDDTDRAQAELEKALNSELAVIQNQAVVATREQLGKNFRVTLTGDERLADALDSIVTHNVDRLVRPYANILPALLALSLFFFLAVFIFFYELIVRGLGMLLFISLKIGGAVKIVHEPVEAERLSL